MFASKLQIRLPRRITAYFLLFGMTALLWLGVAVIYIAHSVTESRLQSGALRSLAKANDRFSLAMAAANPSGHGLTLGAAQHADWIRPNYHRVLRGNRIQTGGPAPRTFPFS